MFRTIPRLLGAVVLAVGLAGPTAAQDRVLRVNDAPIGELDPHKGKDYADSMLMFNVYDFLVRASADGRMVPDLAESWTISDDGLTYTFKLRDAVFHDGSPVEAEDVIYSADRIATLKRGFSYLLPEFESVTADGPKTVVFTLKEPSAPFVAALTRLAVVNSEVVSANYKEGRLRRQGRLRRPVPVRRYGGIGLVHRREPQSPGADGTAQERGTLRRLRRERARCGAAELRAGADHAPGAHAARRARRDPHAAPGGDPAGARQGPQHLACPGPRRRGPSTSSSTCSARRRTTCISARRSRSRSTTRRCTRSCR